MFKQIYYLLRSKKDGKYLVAKIEKQQQREESNYLLLFKENFEALSYLNAHAPEYSNQFTLESVDDTQLQGIIKRWSFTGVGMVEDPLIPTIKFLA